MLILILYAVFGLLFWRSLQRPAIANHKLGPYGLCRFLVMIHLVVLLGRTLEMNQVYRRDVFEVMAWLPIFLYFVGSRRKESLRLLYVLWPLSFLTMILAVAMENTPLLSMKAMDHAQSVFIHIVLAMAGFASFLLVSLSAFIYIWQRILLKKYRTAGVLSFMPSLVELGAVQWRSLLVGLFLFTAAIGLGKLSPYLWGIEHQWGAKELLSVLIWTYYLILALARKRLLLNKDRFAYVTLLGLLLVFLTFFTLDLLSLTAVEGSP